MKTSIKLALFVAALLQSANHCFADGIVFDSGDHTSAGRLSYDNLIDGNPFFSAADSFSVSTTTPITGLTWKGFYFNGTADLLDEFAVVIIADNAGQPAAPGSFVFDDIPGTSRIPSGQKAEGQFTVYSYSMTFDKSFTAAAGTTYWLTILNMESRASGIDPWFWSMDPSAGNGFDQTSSVADWTATGDAETFQLFGPVPEPSTALLLTASAIGLLLTRRQLRT